MKIKKWSSSIMAVTLMFLLVMTANAAILYKDVSTSFWGYDDVMWASENGLMLGVAEQEFAPDEPMSRAMLATVLWRYEESPEAKACNFKDVEKNSWYSTAIDWAAENGIVYGVGDDKFMPDEEITREQIVTIMYRYIISKKLNVSEFGNLSAYVDAKQVSTWAEKAMIWSVEANIIKGMVIDGKQYLSPEDNATRAQVAAILHRFDAYFTELNKCGDGHTAVVDKAVSATCTATGLTEGSHCSVCNEVLSEQKVVEKLPHTPETVAAKQATCTAAGLTEGKRCSVCKSVLTAQQETALLEHAWMDATCTTPKKCESCGKIEGSALEHSFVEQSATDGKNVGSVITRVCSGCSLSDEITIQPITISAYMSSMVSFSGWYSSVGYTVASDGGYGKHLYKYEIFMTETSSTPALTEDYSESTYMGWSSRWYCNGNVLQITVMDEAGNTATERFVVE